MFTGIITDMGEVIERDDTQGDVRFKIKTGKSLTQAQLGASICCSGCCLTVIEMDEFWFCVDVSKESLDKTTLGQWQVGAKINLERSLKVGDELGGHIVSGHVDGVAKLLSVKKEGDSHRITIEIPKGFESYITPKGSVALDGISLTVNEAEGRCFGVNIIPHTWMVTTLGLKIEGSFLNFEIDPMARYVAKYVDHVMATKYA